MCGIAALLGPSSPGELESLTREMISVIPHRGPDGEGTISGPLIALGHKRLAIIDLSENGAQPMPSRDRRHWITYNGEIYNFRELRQELEAIGAQFHSHCDTEVILAAYQEWGESCLSKFNGMFAFVIWDSVDQKAFVARDRFGVKPLYWWKSPQGQLAFASEIKQFTALPGWSARLNSQRAYDFLCWAITDHTSETLFDGVFHIQPGTFAEIDLKTLSMMTKRWYSLRPSSKPASTSDFLATLTDAVRLRLRADVPVGSCLSGGLDSTSIVAIMNAELKKTGHQDRQKTFSAVFPGESFDESTAIRETVQQLQIPNFQTTPTKNDFESTLEKLVWHQDEPFTSTSLLAQWSVFKLARANGVKVMLDGQGADEQLGGYHSFFGPHLFGILKSKGIGAYWCELSAIQRLHGYSRANLILKSFNHSLPNRLRSFARRLLGKNDSHPNWLDLKNLGAVAEDPWAKLPNRIYSSQDFSKALLTAMNLQMLLRFEDRNSMAHSVEARVPFLDYRLVEVSLGLPESAKIQNGQTKLALRTAMSGKIPESIRSQKRKIGFEAPQENWFQNTSFSKDSWPLEILTKEGRTLIKRFEDEGQSAITPLLFRILIFQKWRQVFSVEL